MQDSQARKSIDPRRRNAGGEAGMLARRFWGNVSASPRADRRACMLIVVLWVFGILAAWWAHAPPDLMSTYIAGQLYRDGALDALYLTKADFANRTHAEWQTMLAARGLERFGTYPYVYPPLWAVLAAAIPADVPPATVFRLAYVIGALACALSAMAALRIAAPPGPRAPWLAALLISSLVTIEGRLSLYHCQPQILVGLLILLAAEKARSNRDWPAGIALAFAAAIKLYPALLALWWLTERRWRALAVFCGVGGALGGLSLALGGFGLHLAFLGQLDDIRSLLQGNAFNLNFENLLFQILHSGQLPRDPQTGSLAYFSFYKPGWVKAAAPAIALAGATLIALRWRKGDAQWRMRALFPAALILVSLSLPIGWAHQFLIVLYLVPALAVLYGLRLALLIGLGLLASHSGLLLDPLSGMALPVMAFPLIGVASYLALFFLFALAPRRAPHQAIP